ncbi:MAG: Holliday junction resolvase-like protein [Patescibacteria group bacterium]
MNPFIIPQLDYFWLYYLLIIALFVILAYGYGFWSGRKFQGDKEWSSKRLSRAVLGGKFSEQVAPFLPNFPKDLKASEARFIGQPIDFLIFKGMDDKSISEVVFVEMKTGKSWLNTNQKTLRDAIINKRVRWYEHRIDERVSKIGSGRIAANAVTQE